MSNHANTSADVLIDDLAVESGQYQYRNTIANSYAKQTGFTLVELLVGLVLTVFISAIAITYMVSSSQAFRVQTNDSLSHENARYALEVLSQNVRLAGLNPQNDITQQLDVVYLGTGCEAGNEGSNSGSAAGQCTVDDLSNSSDRFAVDYIADSDIEGCNGAEITASIANQVRVANIFWTADLDNDGVRSLYCQTINVTTGSDEGTDARPLIDGVDAMQVQYGVATDVNVDPNNYIERYQSFSNLGAGDNTNVKAIRIALLINSGLSGVGDTQLEDPVNRQYQLLDASVDINDDRVFRQVYSTTIAVPNTF